MTDTTTDAAEAQAAQYNPTEADKLADRLLQSIAFKVYTSDDDAIREAATMLRRLATAEAASGAGEREKLRAMSDRATPGPWAWEQCGEREDAPVVGIAFPGEDPDCKAPYEGEFRDSDASRMTIAYDWQWCDGHSPSANACFAVASVNYVRSILALAAAPTISVTQSDGWTDAGKAWLAAGAAIVPEGMKPWHGGDEPADWDGGPVLRRHGGMSMPRGPYAWLSNGGGAGNVIAYTPKATMPASGAAIPEGMKPWNGRYGPPHDVDHTKPAMRRDGQMTPTPITGNQWLHVPSHADADIVAYTPKAASA